MNSIKIFADWIKASSQSTKAPLFGKIERGQYAVLVAADLDQSWSDVVPSNAEAEALILLIRSDQVPTHGLPEPSFSFPANQPDRGNRIAHIRWLLDDGRFPGLRLISLLSENETLQEAMDRQTVGSLEQTGLLFVIN